MRLIKDIRLILTFYKSFLLATLVITACCIQIFWKYGIETFFVLFWFKVFTLIVIFYFIRKLKSKEFYYYQNLGVSKLISWTTTLVFDFSLFIFSLVITYKFK